jgi:glycosyltransferase involved in cell wall biosynthesis
LRILHVHSGNLFGGVETALLSLVREQARAPRIEPAFALCFDGRLARELRALGATVRMLAPVRARNPLSVMRARRRLAEVIEVERIDAVICHMPWAHAIFAPAVRRSGRPLVFWMHNPANGRHWVERWAARTAPDLAICNSRFTAATIVKLFTPARSEILCFPLETGGPRLPTSERDALRMELGAPTGGVAILQASRMEPMKGHESHLRALGILRDHRDWVCWMAGDAERPPERAYLERLAALAHELGIDGRVKFLGHRGDVRKLMLAADVFCQPNAAPDAFGLVFVEALGAGLPVVTTAMGGACEIVDERCGILTPPDDVPALARALLKLIEDPAERLRLGSAGPARAALLCDPAARMAEFEEILLGLVDGASANRKAQTGNHR